VDYNSDVDRYESNLLGILYDAINESVTSVCGYGHSPLIEEGSLFSVFPTFRFVSEERPHLVLRIQESSL
jgi:hypothetical protein